MPSKLKKAIGAVKDQTSIGLAMVVKNNSSNLDIAVLKATTHDTLPVDEKHINEVLLLLTSNSKLYPAAACAQAIAKRIGRTRNWIVALKSLMLVLRIFQHGDPYFPREVLQAMKGGAKILNLSNFRDDSSNKNPWDYTAYVRTYALYLDERLECFLMGKLDRMGPRSNDRVYDMKPPMLLDRISYWQRLLDRAITTRPTGSTRSSRLVQISLYSIVRESFDLYRDISDGLALLLDSFFHLQYQSGVDAFQTCIKASKQFEELSWFYTSCKNMEVGLTSEYPSVQKISDELLDALREFLKDQESFPSGNPRSTVQPIPLLLPAPADDDSSASNSGLLDPFEKQQFENSEQQLDEGGSEIGSQRFDQGASTDVGTSPSMSTDQDQLEGQNQLEDLMGLINSNTSMNEAVTTCPTASVLVDQEQVEGQFQLDDLMGLSANTSTNEAVTCPSASLVDQQEQLEGQFQFDDLMGLNSTTSRNEAVACPSSASPMDQVGTVLGGLDLVIFIDDEQQPSVSEAGAAEGSGREGWELMLAEISNNMSHSASSQEGIGLSSSVKGGFDASFLDSIYNQVPVFDLHQLSYNPFLQDTSGIADTSNTAYGQNAEATCDTGLFSSLPTFEATPTFCAQKPDDATAWTWHVDNDPFAPLPLPQTDQIYVENDAFAPLPLPQTDQILGSSTNQQQHLLHEQQLWLQHQNEIIAKHANVA